MSAPAALSRPDSHQERRALAKQLQGEGLGVEDIAARVYGRSDGFTIAAARGLLRGEG